MKWSRWMPVRLLGTVLVAILMLKGGALSQNEALPHANEDRAGRDATETLIGGGDLLRVSVFGVKDFDVDARVSARGSVSLPLIGEVQVAELTTDEAQAVIEKRLIDGQFMLHPQVSVFAKEYATQGVSVLGEVQKPGIYPLLGSHGLFEVLSMAGGYDAEERAIRNHHAPEQSEYSDTSEAGRGREIDKCRPRDLARRFGVCFQSRYRLRRWRCEESDRSSDRKRFRHDSTEGHCNRGRSESYGGC